MENKSFKFDDMNKNQEAEALIKHDNDPNNDSAVLITMFQFANKIDIALGILGFVSAFIFSLAPVVLVLLLGEILNKLDNNELDSKDFYEDMRKIAIENIIAAGISMITC